MKAKLHRKMKNSSVKQVNVDLFILSKIKIVGSDYYLLKYNTTTSNYCIY